MIDLNNFLRYLVMKKITGNLGDIIETDDKIICYIKKLDTKDDYTYIYNCYGIGERNIKLANKYNLNKQIVYVFEDLDFKRDNVFICGYDDPIIVTDHDEVLEYKNNFFEKTKTKVLKK